MISPKKDLFFFKGSRNHWDFYLRLGSRTQGKNPHSDSLTIKGLGSDHVQVAVQRSEKTFELVPSLIKNLALLRSSQITTLNKVGMFSK